MLLLIAGLVAALVDLVAVAAGWHGLRLVTKPLPALLFMVAAYRRPAIRPRLFAVGLAFAAIGDEALLQSGESAFLAGMLAFSVMQALYVRAFTYKRPIDLRTRPLLRVLYFAAFAAGWYVLLPHAGTYLWPIVAYGFLLLLMSNAALGFSATAALGAIVFTISDTTLAFAKFTPYLSLPPASIELLIMATYVAAQFLLTRAVLREPIAA